jgi:glycosyltransferase involved in cell wall biosynthesis
MKIAFDAKRALNNHTGLGNYARIFLNALMRDFPENNYLLFTPKITDSLFHELRGNFKVLFPESLFEKTFHPLWRSFGVKNKLAGERVNIYHGLSNELPYAAASGYKTVVTIHDLIFLKHKEQYPLFDRRVYEAKTKYAVRHADKIVAVSAETRKDLIEVYGVPEKKIAVIYPAADPVFYAANPIKQKPKTKYILNVGSFVSRKNQLKLVEAYAIIANQIEEELWLVGSGKMESEIINLVAKKGLQGRVKIIKTAANTELPVLYSQASVFVYPSLFEGFGMPIVESLFSKTPVITTGGGAMEEAAGKDSLFIDPRSAQDIAAKILMVLNNASIGHLMISKGYEHALTMTDKIMAQKMIELYAGLIQ